MFFQVLSFKLYTAHNLQLLLIYTAVVLLLGFVIAKAQIALRFF